MDASAYFLDRYFYHTLTNNNFIFCVCGEMNLAHPIPAECALTNRTYVEVPGSLSVTWKERGQLCEHMRN
jgi:hypothetical protein